MTTIPVSEPALPCAADAPRLLIVPVDGTRAAQRAVALAEKIAVRDDTAVLLVGLAPAGPALDIETLQARLTLDEYGVGAPAPLPPIDGEAYLTRVVRALVPAQRRLAAAGVPAALRMLRSHEPAAELRSLLADARGTLVLVNPRDLGGSLRALTGELLVEPPCNVYVAGLARPARAPRWHILTALVRCLWRPRV
ncbi:MAG TPA: hypothetical protein VH916_02395 [Dehalococcoidia bacterium]|jgi:nucleotide-binding universal stress UspA family protein